MNLHPVLNRILEDARSQARDRMDRTPGDQKIAEYRFTFVETFLRLLQQEGLAIVRTAEAPGMDHDAIIADDARARLRSELADDAEELTVREEPIDGELVKLVDLEDVLDMIDPSRE